MKKTILNLSLVLILIFSFTGCSSSNQYGSSNNLNGNENKENGSQNFIPDNLMSCDPNFFKRGGDGIAPDCDTFGGSSVCSFHTKEKNGETKIENIQYNNACTACRFYGETGVREMGSTKFTHHGYLEENCDGIIWKK